MPMLFVQRKVDDFFLPSNNNNCHGVKIDLNHQNSLFQPKDNAYGFFPC